MKRKHPDTERLDWLSTIGIEAIGVSIERHYADDGWAVWIGGDRARYYYGKTARKAIDAARKAARREER